jgi:hypothetical protein
MDNEPTLTICKWGIKRWWLNGEYHRADGPAVEWPFGSKEWWLNDERHRIDGPAIEDIDGDKEWYLNHKRYDFDAWLEANKFISNEEKVMLKLTYG